MHNPLVSIVVLTYNSSGFVLETLESIKKQTYSNIELIVTDDCSPDNTIEVVKKWIDNNKNRFLRALVIEAPVNGGIPANCNRGCKAANGEYIKPIAGDDILLDNCIQDNIQFAIENHADMVLSDMYEFNDKSDRLRVKKEDLRKIQHFFKLSELRQKEYYIRNPIFINTPTEMFTRKIYEIIGGFDENYKILEDQVFFIKALTNGYVFKYNPVKTVKYRTQDSISEYRVKQQQIELFKCFYEYRRPYLKYYKFFDLLLMYNYYLESIIFNYKHIKKKKNYLLEMIRYSNPLFNLYKFKDLFGIN